jgi:hypothetical protein
MRRRCFRNCWLEGANEHATADEARRHDAAFRREDRDARGRRPPLSLLPLKRIERARETGELAASSHGQAN